MATSQYAILSSSSAKSLTTGRCSSTPMRVAVLVSTQPVSTCGSSSMGSAVLTTSSRPCAGMRWKPPPTRMSRSQPSLMSLHNAGWHLAPRNRRTVLVNAPHPARRAYLMPLTKRPRLATPQEARSYAMRVHDWKHSLWREALRGGAPVMGPVRPTVANPETEPRAMVAEQHWAAA